MKRKVEKNVIKKEIFSSWLERKWKDQIYDHICYYI
jgi:hypothetical protein